MAPQDKHRGVEISLKKEEVAQLQLNTLKKSIPEECFVKSLPKATAYMFFDLSLWAGITYGMWLLKHSEAWVGLEYWQQVAASVVYWNVAGFVMWCIFIIGHDCGHGTFSDYEWVNDIVGHITHGAILVPFYPWQLSHRRHHMYHNHIDKDYSHPWYTPDKLLRDEEALARMMDNSPLLRFFFPIFGWPIYLYGMPDGSHWLPLPWQRMWKDTPAVEYYRCIISTAVVAGYLFFGYSVVHQSNVQDFLYYYIAPWIVMGWWLVTVTYLQHHDHGTLVYDDHDWKFVSAAFETIDRKFGYGLDVLHHHITDGHVVHHLFFTKIPHYNLPKATRALVEYLKSINLGHLYKSDITYDFPYRVHKHYVEFGFRSTRASEVEKKAH